MNEKQTQPKKQEVSPQNKHLPDKTKGFMEACMLLLLMEKSTYGYQLLESLTRFNIRIDSSNAGVIYRALRRLEKEGKVVSAWDTQGNGPARRLYEVTKAGKDTLKQRAVNLRNTRDRIDKFLSCYNSMEEK